MSAIHDQSMEINIKNQSVAVGSRIQVKYVNLDDTNKNKKMLHVVEPSNNLQAIKRKIQESLKGPIQLYYFDDDQKLVEFITDQQFLSFLSTKSKILYRFKLPNSLKKVQSLNAGTFQRSMIKQSKKIEARSKDNETKQIIIEEKVQKHHSPHQISPKSSKLRIKPSSQIKMETTEVKIEKPEANILAQRTQETINNILQRNHSQLVQILFHQTNNSNAKFDVPCSFCKKTELRNRIAACQANLNVVACQNCSQYLAYQLPFPFKIYTSAEEYAADRSKQPRKAEALFAQKFKHEKEERNKRILQQLKALPVLNDL